MKKILLICAVLLTAMLCSLAFAEGSVETPVTLTIGDVTLDAYLNDTLSAQELISRLPVTVHLYNSGHDYCGGINPALPYEESDVQYGWKNGDLAFWTAGDDFVIFHNDEETSGGTGNLVILGHVTSDIEEVRALSDAIDVIIALKEENPVSALKMKITVGDQVLTATLEDNATSRYLMEKMPMTLPMMDLYGREMCYRFSGENIPANEATYGSFDVGKILYWTPWHSFVIVYAESGESIDDLQFIGTVDEGVELFSTTGDVNVTFEMMEE